MTDDNTSHVIIEGSIPDDVLEREGALAYMEHIRSAHMRRGVWMFLDHVIHGFHKAQADGQTPDSYLGWEDVKKLESGGVTMGDVIGVLVTFVHMAMTDVSSQDEDLGVDLDVYHDLIHRWVREVADAENKELTEKLGMAGIDDPDQAQEVSDRVMQRIRDHLDKEGVDAAFLGDLFNEPEDEPPMGMYL